MRGLRVRDHGIRRVPWIQAVVFFSNDDVSVFVSTDEKHPVLQGKNALLDYFYDCEQQPNKVNDAVIKQVLEALA